MKRTPCLAAWVGALAVLAVCLETPPPPRPSRTAVRAPAPDTAYAARADGSGPAVRGPHAGSGDDLSDVVLSLARHRARMDPATWARLRNLLASAADRGDQAALQPALARLRVVLAEVLHAAAKPGAPYGGGAEAVAVAAAVADDATCELMLDMVRARETVIAKLPLTTRRDDLDFLDHALGALVARGTRRQHQALAGEIAVALRFEHDPQARRVWTRHETKLRDRLRGDGS